MKERKDTERLEKEKEAEKMTKNRIKRRREEDKKKPEVIHGILIFYFLKLKRSLIFFKCLLFSVFLFQQEG